MLRVRAGCGGWQVGDGVFRVCRLSGLLGSGGELPASVVGEAHGDEASQIDGGGAVGEPDSVVGDTAIGDASTGSDEPGQAAFDHRAVLSVVVSEVAVAPGASGLDEFGVVEAQDEGPAVVAGRAA